MSALRGLHLHFDGPSGAAGDMTLGALLDLGVPEAAVREALGRLPVRGYRLTARKAMRGGLVGTDVRVELEGGEGGRPAPASDHQVQQDPERGDAHADGEGAPHGHADGTIHSHEHAHAHRHYREIRAMLIAHLEGRTRDLALAIFDRLADAEARLHGVSVDEVAFHEVGAVDSIVDIVGAAAAIAWLAPRGVSGAPIALGHGSVRAAHGLLPVPAPATLEICRAAGVPTIDGGLARELCTPTGAAILATVVERWGEAPPMTARAIGYGAGDAELRDRPNLLRAVVGEPLAGTAPGLPAASSAVQLEANLDDMSPELCEHVADRLFEAGALDVWWAPIVMKKTRPAFTLGVLAPPERVETLADVILAETTTLGVRHAVVARRVLERRIRVVATPYGEVPVKLGLAGGRVLNAAPEYEACRSLARARNIPLKEVYAAALAALRGEDPPV